MEQVMSEAANKGKELNVASSPVFGPPAVAICARFARFFWGGGRVRELERQEVRCLGRREAESGETVPSLSVKKREAVRAVRRRVVG